MKNKSAPDIQETELEIYNGDCVTGMSNLPANSVDLVVTSPPYNLGIQYGKYDDSDERQQYLDWCLTWAEKLHKIIKNDGSFFLNVGASPSNPMLPHEILFKLKDLFVLQNTLHWIKAITVETKEGKNISTGHFKPINSRRYVNDCHEYIFHLTKSGNTPIDRLSVGVPYVDKSNIGRWSHTEGNDKRCRGNNWFIPYKTIQNRKNQRPHPASFPMELAAQCIKLHGWRSELVMLDPFLGIGNSAIAAQECGIKKFIGFEIDEDYLYTAAESLKISKECIKLVRSRSVIPIPNPNLKIQSNRFMSV